MALHRHWDHTPGDDDSTGEFNHSHEGGLIIHNHEERLLFNHRPLAEYHGCYGWKLSKKHESIMHEEMQRLADLMPSRSITYDFYAARHTVGDTAIAFLHCYVDGSADSRGSDLRIYPDDIPDFDMKKRYTTGMCVNEVFEQLHDHVDKVVQNYRKDPRKHITDLSKPTLVLGPGGLGWIGGTDEASNPV